jgi:hypothetical protein
MPAMKLVEDRGFGIVVIERFFDSLVDIDEQRSLSGGEQKACSAGITV